MRLNGHHVHHRSSLLRTLVNRLAQVDLPPLGGLLARLGGADPKILRKAPSAKGRFIQMGLVLLSTACLAVVSMSFALVDGLEVSWWFAIPLGIGWGFVILNIDRMLIQNIRPGRGWGHLIGMVLPRLLMAGLLGVVIATPLVLRVFASEIQAEMRISNAEAAINLDAIRQETPEAKRLTEVKAKIAESEGILAGNLPGLTSPNVQAATDRLARAEEDLEKKRAAANKAYLDMRCELDGYKCNDGSGNKGAGPRYRALKRIYDVAARDLENAEQAVTSARDALSAANEEAAATNDTKLAEAQTRTRDELPGLVQERDRLQQVVNAKVGDDGKSQERNTGLLARLEALDRLGDRSSMAELAHWAVALLFFMIELLPVLVKVLNSVGRPSLYDRISELEENSSFDDAILERNNNRRHIEGHSKKQREIEEDMRKRETALGIKANEHVANEMEKILDVALRQWSVNVTNTLHGGAEGGSTLDDSSATPTAPTATGRSGQPNPAEQTIRNNFNLPAGSNL